MILRGGYTHGGDVYHNCVTLDFSANVNPFGTPEAVKAAICEAAEQIAIYPDPYCGPLRSKLSALHRVAPDEIVCGNGAAELIYLFAAALKPRNTLLPVPSFSDYEAALRAAGCEATPYPLLREEGFALTERISDAITERVDCLMLCSPNNPTGRTIEPALLLRILDRCRKTGTWLFLDESFFELCDEDKAYSLIDALQPDDRVLILRAFTKAYGMAGVRLGYAVSKNRALLEAMSNAVQPWNVSTVAQAAGLAALNCSDWTKTARSLFAAEKPYLERALRTLGVTVLHSDANFMLLSGVPTLYERLKQRGILIRDCSNYRGLQAGDCRIAVRTHAENAALIAAIREVLHASDRH